MRQTYSILKISEGGITIKDAKTIARESGLKKIDTFGSVYVGQFCLVAEGTERQHRKFTQLLWPEGD